MRSGTADLSLCRMIVSKVSCLTIGNLENGWRQLLDGSMGSSAISTFELSWELVSVEEQPLNNSFA